MADNCVHYWMCDEANGGRTVRTVCRYCGEVRQCVSYLDDADITYLKRTRTYRRNTGSSRFYVDGVSVGCL